MKHHHSTPQPPARAVVLGGTGFVGKAILARLGADQIPVLSLGSADIDLLQPESADKLAGVLRPDDALVICSTLTPDKGKDIRTMMKNLTMGEHVCAALAKVPCAHVIYVSSDAVYAEVTPVSEASNCDPGSFHGVMHLGREKMLQATVKSIPLAVLRPSAIYGVGDTHNSYGPNRFVGTARADGKITLFGQGEEIRDHLYVQDLAAVVHACLTHQSEGIVNVACGQAVSFFKAAKLVESLLGQPVQIECLKRGGPITHRHFDLSLLVKTFPAIRLTSLENGLAVMLGQS